VEIQAYGDTGDLAGDLVRGEPGDEVGRGLGRRPPLLEELERSPRSLDTGVDDHVCEQGLGQ
jgi:hypothetical protein